MMIHEATDFIVAAKANGIKPDTPYKLDGQGQFVESEGRPGS